MICLIIILNKLCGEEVQIEIFRFWRLWRLWRFWRRRFRGRRGLRPADGKYGYDGLWRV